MPDKYETWSKIIWIENKANLEALRVFIKDCLCRCHENYHAIHKTCLSLHLKWKNGSAPVLLKFLVDNVIPNLSERE